MKKIAVAIIMLSLSCVGFGSVLYTKYKSSIDIATIMFGAVLLITGIYLVVWMKVNKNMLDKGQHSEKIIDKSKENSKSMSES